MHGFHVQFETSEGTEGTTIGYNRVGGNFVRAIEIAAGEVTLDLFALEPGESLSIQVMEVE